MKKIKVILWEPGQGQDLGNASGSPAVNAWDWPSPGAARSYRLTFWSRLLTFWSAANVREYTYFTFSSDCKKHDFYGVFEM